MINEILVKQMQHDFQENQLRKLEQSKKYFNCVHSSKDSNTAIYLPPGHIRRPWLRKDCRLIKIRDKGFL
jgi:hypothetical protein